MVTFERYWHNDFASPLVCDTYVSTLLERIGERWVILSVKYADGSVCFYSVLLKPDRWMSMPKEKASVPIDDFTGYTYDKEGPFGYRCVDIASAKEKVYALCERLRPKPIVAAPAPIVIAEEVTVPPVVVKKKRVSTYQRMCERKRRERARLRRLEKFSEG